MTGRRQRFDIRQTGKQILLVVGALYALNLAFYGFWVRPTVGEFNRLDRSTGPEFEAMEQRTAIVEAAEAFLAALRRAEDDLHGLREEILATREERMVEVHAELSNLAQRFKIDLDTVNYENELLLAEELDRHGMVVPLEGGYTALRKFLQATEKSDAFLVVERVALAKGKQGGNLLQLNISLATYFNAPEDLVRQKRAADRRVGRRRS